MLGIDSIKSAVKDGIQDSAILENPFGTANGQMVVSNSENFWARLRREGKMIKAYTTGISLTGTGAMQSVSSYALVPSANHVLYVSKIICGSDVDTQFVLNMVSGVQDAGNHFFNFLVKAGESKEISFDGDIELIQSGSGHIDINSIAANTVAYNAMFTLYGYEVPESV